MFTKLQKLTLSFSIQKCINRIPPWSVLILCLFFTALAVYTNYQFEEQAQQVRFQKIIDSLHGAIETRFRIYTNVLRATQGLYLTDKPITEKQFADFTQNFKLEERYPGIQGIGFNLRISADNINSVEKKMRDSGYTDFIVWPQTKKKELFPIIHLEPKDWRNQRALGFDMSSEENRWEAMKRSRDNGDLASSKRVTLVQEVEKDLQYGFVVFAPIYTRNMPISTVEERRKALYGFVYSPFRLGDLFKAIAKEHIDAELHITFSVYDSEKNDSHNLIYSFNQQDEPELFARPKRTAQIPFNLHGNQWLLEFNSTHGFEPSPMKSPFFLIGLLGITVSSLVFFLLQKTKEVSQTKSRFLSEISHEIRNPLGAIVGFTDLALDTPNLNNELKKYLVAIKNNGTQLIRLVGEVLDISKIEANKLEVENKLILLPQFIEEILSSLEVRALQKNIKLKWINEYPLPKVISTDPIKLRQILTNIIGNSIKFTNEGQVTLSARISKRNEERKSIELEFIIQDTGIGISYLDQKKLFQPFTQAKAKDRNYQPGTGLGLALSRNLAKMLGGSLELVHSEPGSGSTFSLKLNIFDYKDIWDSKEKHSIYKEPQVDSLNTTMEDLEGVHVLLVEDSKDNQYLFSRYLRRAGAIVDLVSNGEEAVNYILNSAAPDIILMDIEMPVLDGVQATFKIRQLGFSNPILGLSGNALEEEKTHILNAGFNQYITKPVSRDKLVEFVHRQISATIE